MRNTISISLASILLLASPAAVAQQGAVRQACGAEIQQHCGGIRPGDGRIRACITEHFGEFSEPCKKTLLSSVDVVKACKADVQQTCSGVHPGGGRIQACMKDHFTEYSQPCKQAIITVKFGSR